MAPKKKRKTIDNKSLSRRPVVCGECNKTLERYGSMNPHFDIVHHGKAPFEKGQTKLNLGAPTRKRPFRSNEAEDTSNADTSATASNDPLPLSPPVSPVTLPVQGKTVDLKTNNEIICDMRNLIYQLETNLSLTQTSQFKSLPRKYSSNISTCSTQPSLTTSPPRVISETKSFGTKPKQLLESQKSKPINESKISSQLKLLHQSSCLKHITNLLDDVFELNLEETKLKCLYCFSVNPNYGTFDVEDVEFEKLPARSQKFRNLTKILRKHLELDSHQANVNSNLSVNFRKSQRNRDMGNRLGRLSYFIYFNDLPFAFYETILPWFALNYIDMGEVNHSKRFIQCFLASVYDILLSRLKSLLKKPLPCTGKPSPFVILGDNGTVKRDVTQPTLIRVVTLNKGNIFQTFYLSHPEVTCHTGEHITDLLISSITDTL